LDSEQSKEFRKNFEDGFAWPKPSFLHFVAITFRCFPPDLPNEHAQGRRHKMANSIPKNEQFDTADPPILLAILIAARRTGDRLLETVARRELEERHRIKISFTRESEVEPCSK
jgi:hypothetical protein